MRAPILRTSCLALTVLLIWADTTGAANILPFSPALRFPPPPGLSRPALRPAAPAPGPAEDTRQDWTVVARWLSDGLDAAVQAVSLPADLGTNPFFALHREAALAAEGSLRENEPVLEGGADVLVPQEMAAPWRDAPGLRFRLVFLRPYAVSEAGPYGLRMDERDGRSDLDRAVRLPRRYWGAYPVYLRSQPIPFILEVENTGDAARSGLAFRAAREAFEADGGAGRPAGPAEFIPVGALAPGQATVIRGSFQGSTARGGGRFSQAHLTVLAPAKDGFLSILADVPQAALIDPPAAE